MIQVTKALIYIVYNPNFSQPPPLCPPMKGQSQTMSHKSANERQDNLGLEGWLILCNVLNTSFTCKNPLCKSPFLSSIWIPAV